MSQRRNNRIFIQTNRIAKSYGIPQQRRISVRAALRVVKEVLSNWKQ